MRGIRGLRSGVTLAWLVLAGLVLLAAGRAAAEVTAVDGGIQFSYVNDGVTQVFWAGDFNGWSTTANPFTKEGDRWTIVLPLPAGEHMYKFVVDGAWMADPENPETKGDYANSVIRVGADGKLAASAAAAPLASPLNPKIFVNGRFISLFQAIEDRTQADRLELRRPDFDLDLDYRIKMSEVLDARILTNVRSERDNVPFWQTRLNFDRGHLNLHSDKINLYAFDEDRVATWEDPLHLVGNVGIYGHDYGYDQQGMQAGKTIAGFDMKLLYSDSFRNPGPTRPSDLLPNADELAQAQIDRGQRLIGSYNFTDSDNNKDALAFQARRPLGSALKLGLSARMDRGQNPGVAGVVRLQGSQGDSTVRFVHGSTLERWNAWGGDLAWQAGSWTLQGEYLRGRNSLDFQNDADGGVVHFTATDTTTRTLRRRDIDSEPIATDNRFLLGARGPWRGVDFDLSLEYHGTDITPLGNDSALALDNRLTTWSAGLARSWTLSHERQMSARLGLSYFDFRYEAGTPWRNQFWFDRHNYWLEAGEHQVTFDRMVLLGGNDVVSWKPAFSLDLMSEPVVNFRYAGTLSGVSLGERPKFIESLFQFTWQATSRTRLYSDTRWVKYDDPVLHLDDGYVSTFLELAYAFTPGIQFALSWGVDPFVIDDPVNEYGYIGRDLYLFSRSATGAQAARDFYSLAALLPRAEKALQDERRIQLEAQVRF